MSDRVEGEPRHGLNEKLFDWHRDGFSQGGKIRFSMGLLALCSEHLGRSGAFLPSGKIEALLDELLAGEIEGIEREATASLKDTLATRDAEIERLKDVAVAAIEAAATFRFYASNHTAKGTEDGDAKAARNVAEAKKLEDAVRQWKEGHHGVLTHGQS